MKRILILLLILINSWGCQEEERAIDPNLMEYIEIFEEEAAARNVNISIMDLEVSAHIMNIQESNVLGQCYTYSDDSREIVIDQEYWEELDLLEKEFLMMHELGHCILDRDHLDDSDENNNCISIMQSGTGDCRHRYNANNRERLLDELFNN